MSHDERNLAHWNKVAKTYNSDHTQKAFGDLINKAHEFILSNISAIGVEFIEPSSTFERSDDNPSQKSVRVLDYACGPGTITNILAGRATEYIGLDLSPNMVNEYNERFSAQTDGEKLNAQAYNANLLAPAGPPESLNDSKFFDFDLVAVGFGFHHFENLPMVTQRLVQRLKPGGVLMILDFFSHEKDDMGNDPAINTISHHGFSESQIKALFASAGLEDNLVLDFGQDITMKQHAKRRPFMARGKKPA
ncbi:hypothetical protein LTR70_004907 [Exophiala xenobiotica]|uniref:S-adenosyl-L-methionine-dependent methyltransferase n=1 Tax=Lithohypha guttulata TaxID=1690604 RepID=A0ABR0KBN2_9EURO|nr:hypothetical protein LTR24_004560 [Lithohypha guttulata]KAK5319723.1 hypothetical protein LTR70_004907 [Exophiala xenobiotica]